jgi:hypothetical protein
MKCLITLFLLLTLNVLWAQKDTQVVTPNIYPEKPLPGCDTDNLSKLIAKECGKLLGDKNIQWGTSKFSKKVCSGQAPLVGQRITYPVHGDVKACHGLGAIPAAEYWVCNFLIDTEYYVIAKFVYYSTCTP